jgi:hypothetical protein
MALKQPAEAEEILKRKVKAIPQQPSYLIQLAALSANQARTNWTG